MRNNSLAHDSDTTSILEGLVTTLHADGRVNLAPMGPRVDAEMARIVLRPFDGSATCANLRRSGQGVLHVTDDALLLAQTAVGEADPLPPLRDAQVVTGKVLVDACRWYEFEVVAWDQSGPRADVTCRVVGQGRGRDFFGWNRAKHAVLEAAILATRVHLLSPDSLAEEFERLRAIVDKTAGPRERAAFAHLHRFLEEHAARCAGGQPGVE